MNALKSESLSIPLDREKQQKTGPARKLLQKLLESADVRINGDRTWDMTVMNQRLYRRLLCHGSLGLGESYMDGWWECERIDELVGRLLKANLNQRLSSPREMIDCLVARCANMQCRSRAWIVARRHYDIGDDLYRAMLDKRMIYSCGYWQDAQDLEAAQEAKLDLIARKLRLEPGMKVLDIGCGWGGTARYLAEQHGVTVTGLTISKNQAATAAKVCRDLPVEIRLEDYRNLRGRFDRIVSVGMFEHVGYKNYRTYMQVVRKLLDRDGLFLLHTIGTGNTLEKVVRTDPWIERYIFPGSMLPAAGQLLKSFDGLFLLEDWHNFGADYDRTLMQWYENFERAWSSLSKNYDQRFYRMWKFYLLSCAASFRVRKNQLWQLVLAPDGTDREYRSAR